MLPEFKAGNVPAIVVASIMGKDQMFVREFGELLKVNQWYDTCEYFQEVSIDYHMKSIQSVMLKYEKYYPDHQAAKIFNDMLGFCTPCDNYEDVLRMAGYENIRVADMSSGKAKDDGYRLRQEYEYGKIKSESKFKGVLGNVLSDCEEIR